MEKGYINPDMAVVNFEVEDVMTVNVTAGGWENGGIIIGGDAEEITATDIINK